MEARRVLLGEEETVELNSDVLTTVDGITPVAVTLKQYVVIKGCLGASSSNQCAQATSSGVTTQLCYCNGDYCNNAVFMSFSFVLMAVALFLSFY